MNIIRKHTLSFFKAFVAIVLPLTFTSCTETIIERVKVQRNASILSGEGVPTRNIGKVGDYYINSLTADLFGPKTKAGWSVTKINLLGEEGYGTVVLSGNGVPANNIGAVGDYYIDLETADLYGPKQENLWGSPMFNMRGEKGVSSILLSGEGEPTAEIGRLGDWYIDTTTGKLYGEKTLSGWTKHIDMVGDKGIGSKIHTGFGRPDNSLGSVGDYYINISTTELYGAKTENGWTAPLFVMRGEKGGYRQRLLVGRGVPSSETGTTFDIYIDLNTGNIYGPKLPIIKLPFPIPGLNNDPWVVSSTQGNIFGSKGSAGANGNTLHSGDTAPQDNLGVEGDWYIDKTNRKLYGPKTTTWGVPIDLS